MSGKEFERLAMELSGECVDDLLIQLYKELLAIESRESGTRGELVEMVGVSLRLSKPRARLSLSENRGKIFSAVGELFWYLSGKNDLEFIQGYIDRYKHDEEDGVIYGGYGPRLFSMRGRINQIKNVVRTLTEKESSKRAVIQLFDAEDIVDRHKEIPCTTCLQFLIRDRRLNMIATMRSNDAIFGLPHDIFCFTMLQEIIASMLNIDIGEYYHFAGSMHYYSDKKEYLVEYSEEGFQQTREMRTMPNGDPLSAAAEVFLIEGQARSGDFPNIPDSIDPYWADIARLIQVHWAKGDASIIDRISASLNDNIFKPYIDARRRVPANV